MSTFYNSKFYFQSLTILSFGLILTASLVTFNFPKISVKAGAGPLNMVVTHPNGINIRDKNCGIIFQAGYGEILDRNSDNPVNITCNIGGQNTQMVNYGVFFGFDDPRNSQNMFVAEKFVAQVIDKTLNDSINDNQAGGNKMKLNNPGGVNLRDENCQRVTTLPNGTITGQPPANYNRGEFKVCKAGGNYYKIIHFFYQNKTYNVATILTKFE